MHCANTVAAQYAKVPPFATYTVHTKLHLFKKDESFDRRVSVRTADQVAVVLDERTSRDELKAPFPAPPNLDPLATFKLRAKAMYATGDGPHRDLDMRISNIDPLRYSNKEHSDANVVARAVRGYSVEVIDDAGDRLIHLHLIAGPQVRHTAQFWFQDVYIDTSTDLPIRVAWAADDATMIADYETVQGYWLLKSLSLRATFFAPLHIGRTTVAFDSSFDSYGFSDVAPDPRLVPGALPTPIATAPATP